MSQWHLVHGAFLLAFTFGSQNFFIYAFGFYTDQPDYLKCNRVDDPNAEMEVVEIGVGCKETDVYEKCRAYLDDEELC